MRKTVERLLIWFVPVALLSFAAGTAISALGDREAREAVASTFGWSPLLFGVYLKLSQSLLWAAGNLVVALWLGFQQHSSSGRRALWTLFGLASGLWAVAPWLLVQLAERRAESGT